MLVITRKVNDSLIIEMEGKDQTIEIKVTEIGNQVRLAIDAPPGCKIWRKELYQTIQANRQAAAEPGISHIRSLISRLPSETVCQSEQAD